MRRCEKSRRASRRGSSRSRRTALDLPTPLHFRASRTFSDDSTTRCALYVAAFPAPPPRHTGAAVRKSHRRACAPIWQESLGSSYDVDRTAQPACDSLNTLPRNEISPQTHRERASEFLLRIKARFEPSIYTQLVTILSTLSHATQQSSIIEVRDTHTRVYSPSWTLAHMPACLHPCAPTRLHPCAHARRHEPTRPRLQHPGSQQGLSSLLQPRGSA